MEGVFCVKPVSQEEEKGERNEGKEGPLREQREKGNAFFIR